MVLLIIPVALLCLGSNAVLKVHRIFKGDPSTVLLHVLHALSTKLFNICVTHIQLLLNGTNSVEQTAVALLTGLGVDDGWLGEDQRLVLKVLHRVLTHVHRFADGFVAGPALKCFAVHTVLIRCRF